MYTQFVISLIGIRNEVNPLAHRWEFQKIKGMIYDAGAYGEISLDEFHALLALIDEIEKDLNDFDIFLWEMTK